MNAQGKSLLALLGVLLALPALQAKEPPGPLAPVKCFAPDGPLSGQEFDAASKLENAPGALLFVHKLTPATARTVRELDQLFGEFALLGFRSQTILLAADRAAAEAQLKRSNNSWQLSQPIVLSLDGESGPAGYAFDQHAALTLVFANEGRKTESLGLSENASANASAVVRRFLVQLVGELPEDPAALKQLIADRLPADPAALKELAASQQLELRTLRAQLHQLKDRLPLAATDAPPPAETPEGMTELNFANFTGRDVAELYHKFTGRRVVASEEAARTEISLVVPGQMTFAQAATIIEKKLVMEGLGLVPDDHDGNLLQLVVQDPSIARKVIGPKPRRVRRVPLPPSGKK